MALQFLCMGATDRRSRIASVPSLPQADSRPQDGCPSPMLADNCWLELALVSSKLGRKNLGLSTACFAMSRLASNLPHRLRMLTTSPLLELTRSVNPMMKEQVSSPRKERTRSWPWPLGRAGLKAQSAGPVCRPTGWPHCLLHCPAFSRGCCRRRKRGHESTRIQPQPGRTVGPRSVRRPEPQQRRSHGIS